MIWVLETLLENLKSLMDAVDVALKLVDPGLHVLHIFLALRSPSLCVRTPFRVVSIRIVRSCAALIELRWIRLIARDKNPVASLVSLLILSAIIWHVAIHAVWRPLWLGYGQPGVARVEGLLHDVSGYAMEGRDNILSVWLVYQFVACLSERYHLSSWSEFRWGQNRPLMSRALP